MKKIDVFNYIVNQSSTEDMDVHIDGAIVDASTQQVLKDWWGDETSVSFKSFRDTLMASKAKKVNIYINSPGGHVGDAMAIHDMLVELQANGTEVTTRGRGIVASAATYILMAGNSEMSANSWFMIHNVSGGVWGDVNIIENYARTLRKFNDSTRDFYASYTGMRKEDVAKMMNAETWMTADEAKEKGFVKSVTGKVSFANMIPADHWDYNNKAVLNIYNKNVHQTIKMDNLSFQNTLASANAEAFEVVENGFLLSEDQLNAIETQITSLQNNATTSTEAQQQLQASLDAANASATSVTAERDAANARIAELEAQVETLNGATPAPVATSKESDPHEDPNAKYMTSVDAEMAKIRALKKKA